MLEIFGRAGEDIAIDVAIDAVDGTFLAELPEVPEATDGGLAGTILRYPEGIVAEG